MVSDTYNRTSFKSGYVNTPDSMQRCKQRDRQYAYNSGGLLDSAYTSIRVMDGLSIGILNYWSNSGLEINYEIKKGPVVFNYILSGNSDVMISEPGSAPVHIKRKPGTATVKFKTESHLSGRLKIPPGEYFSSVAVQIEAHLLKDYIRDDLERLPGDFVECLHNPQKQRGGNRFFSGLTPSMMSAAASLSNYTVNLPVNRLFFQSKAHELICLKLFQLMDQNRKPVTGVKLSARDKKNIFYAREILIKDIKHPPTIPELSRMAGINQLKLKRGFKSEFGTTILDYFNQYRMEKALEILKTGEKNISETAADVGYSNVSHFIHSFKRKYGITPGQALRKAYFFC